MLALLLVGNAIFLIISDGGSGRLSLMKGSSAYHSKRGRLHLITYEEAIDG